MTSDTVVDALRTQWDCEVGTSEDYDGLFVEAESWNREVATLVLELDNVCELDLQIDDSAAKQMQSLAPLTGLRSFDASICTKSRFSFAFAKDWHRLVELTLTTPREANVPAVVELSHFHNCSSLQLIRLYGIDLANTFEILGTRQRLKSLELGRTKIDNKITQLSGCEHLSRLECQACDFTAAAESLSFIRELPIRKLSFAFTNIDDSALEVIANSYHIERLYLEGTDLTEDGLKHFKTLPSLSFASVDARVLTNEGINQLAACESLTELWVSSRNDEIDPKLADTLRDACKHCKITFLAKDATVLNADD